MTDTNGLAELREGLRQWVRLERHAGDPMIKESVVGNVAVVEVNDFPESPPDAVRADLHFVAVAPTEGLPKPDELVQAVLRATGDGEFATLNPDDLAAGPSYMALGAWLGSQDLALMLIGAVELAGIAPAMTPEVLGITGDEADVLAGLGMVHLGPTQVWIDQKETEDV